MYMTFPCLLAGTLEGTLIGSLLPPPANRILHPIIVTCLVINATAAVFGSATGVGYHHTLESYLTKVSTILLGRLCNHSSTLLLVRLSCQSELLTAWKAILPRLSYIDYHCLLGSSGLPRHHSDPSCSGSCKGGPLQVYWQCAVAPFSPWRVFWFGDWLELVVLLLILQWWGCCGLADLHPQQCGPNLTVCIHSLVGQARDSILGSCMH